MAEPVALHLPESHAHLMTDQDRALHEEWAAMSAEQMLAQPAQHHKVDLGHDNFTSYYLETAKGAERTEAVAVLVPYTHGYSPFMQMRVRLAQAMLDKPTNFMVFHNGKNAYSFDEKTPIKEAMAEGVAIAAINAGVEKLHVLGGSQGAMIGGALLRFLPDNFDITDSGVSLHDAPNVVWREAGQLSKDFKKPGIAPLNKAINDSGLPALSKVQHSRGGFDVPGQLLGFGRFWVNSHGKQNARLQEAMTKADFVADVALDPRQPKRLDIIRNEKSLICTDELTRDIVRILHDTNGEIVDVVSEYGHEGADNIVLHALLARRAIQG